MHFRHSELLSRRASFDVSRSVPPCLYIYTWPRDGRDLDMNIIFFLRIVGLLSFALRLIWNQLLDIDCCFLNFSFMAIAIGFCNYAKACTTISLVYYYLKANFRT